MELDFIRRLRERLPQHEALLVGPGDDAAIVDLRGRGDVVVTTDMLTEGVDFILEECGATRVGRKALAVNLSDLAAMAAVPRAVVVSVALPREGAMQIGCELYEGLLPLAEDFETAVAGGDTNTWDGPLVVSITALGTLTDRGPFLRSGARPGDAIVVTGDFGGSLLGKHFDFTPRVREALVLRERYDVHAAIDVSDGLTLDLSRLCTESRCGAELQLAQVPISAAARQAATTEPASGRTALDRALSDGEDFELVLTMPEAEARRLVNEQPFATPVTIVGRIVAEPGLWVVDADGLRPMVPQGFQH